jgi:hypothetical protein
LAAAENFAHAPSLRAALNFWGAFPLIHGVRMTFSTSKNVVVNGISNLLTLSGLGKALTLTEGIEPRQVRL